MFENFEHSNLKKKKKKKKKKTNIFAKSNFWKCPKISKSSSFAKSGYVKFWIQLSSEKFTGPVHSIFGNHFYCCGTKNKSSTVESYHKKVKYTQ